MKSTDTDKHILIVEPDSILAPLIIQALEPLKAHLHLATSAQAAVAAADANTPNIVILELALPVHNGIEFLHEFRSYHEWREVPVIVFSQQHVADPSIFHKVGHVEYLYKLNTSLATLAEHVKGYL